MLRLGCVGEAVGLKLRSCGLAEHCFLFSLATPSAGKCSSRATLRFASAASARAVNLWSWVGLPRPLSAMSAVSLSSACHVTRVCSVCILSVECALHALVVRLSLIIALTLCPSGLRGWTQVPLAQAAWVQIPQVSFPRVVCWRCA